MLDFIYKSTPLIRLMFSARKSLCDIEVLLKRLIHMTRSFYKSLINKLIDWLVAFCVACLLIWFVLTQPVLDSNGDNFEPVRVSTQNLQNHVHLLTAAYAPRTINYNHLNDVSDYINREFSVFGVPENQVINTISQKYRNVSLQLGPDTEEVFVIGAHYDAEDDSIDTEGNASGIATLIELARHLAEKQDQLKLGVILVAYPLSLNQADDVVSTGSHVHAQLLKEENKKIRLMISLDEVAKLKKVNNLKQKKSFPFKFMELLYPISDNSINLIGRLEDFGNIRDLKKGFNNSSELSLQTHNLPESFYKTNSHDHINYWRQGYPAVLISDQVSVNNESGNDINLEPQERIDYEKMANLVDGLYRAIISASSEGHQKTYLARRSRNNATNRMRN